MPTSVATFVKVYGERRNALKQLLESGQAMLFLGAGVEIGIHSSWDMLVNNLLEKSEIVLTADQISLTHSEKAQIAKDHNLLLYKQTILEEFGGWQPITQKVMTGLSHMQVCGVITTNYDASIGDAFAFKGFTALGIEQLSTAYLREHPRRVFHIHGLISDSTTSENLDIILSSDEFAQYYAADGIVREFLKTAFLQKSVVFVGVSFEDIDVIRVLQSVRIEETRLTETASERFALIALPFVYEGKNMLNWSKVEELEDRLGELGITPIWFEADSKYRGLLNLLKEVAPQNFAMNDQAVPEAP